MKSKFSLIVMFLLCMLVGGMRAQSNLTVYQGTDYLGMVPVAGVNFNYYTRSQYVIPAADLKDMKGSGIYCLIYYLDDFNDGKMMKGDVNVYLKEVNYTTISKFEPVSSEDLYYEGALTMTKVDNTRMVLITLKKPFVYNGGNLLIDFENPEIGDAKGKRFYGKKVTGASISAYGSTKSELESKTPSQYNFIPQTTFLYYPRPEITGVSTTPTTATVNWTGQSNSYQLRYSEMSFFDDFEDGFGNWKVEHKGGGTEDTYWQIIKNENNNASYEGDYGVIVFSYYNKTPYKVDHWLISPQVELGGELRYWVRVGDARYPEDYEVYVSTTDKETESFKLLASPGKATNTWTEVCIDLSAYEGQMGYIALRDISDNKYNMLIDNFGIYHNIGEWTGVKDVTSPYTIDNLKEDQSYMIEVKGFSANEYETPWAQCAVITHGNPTPYDVKVSQGAHDATFSWTGFGDSYQLAYRTAEKKNIMTQSFENGYDGWKRVDCHNNSDCNAYYAVCRTGQVGFAFYSDKVTEPQYLISPRLATTTDGTMLSFYYKNYNTSYTETFIVGYSSTTDDISAFTFGNEVSIVNNQWTQFAEAIPAGTKYICIKYTSQDKHYLFLDDIEIYKPQTTSSWNIVTEINTTSTTIDGLDADKQYDFQIRSIKNRKKGKGTSDWISMQAFKTQAALQLANYDAALSQKNIDIIDENLNKTAEVTLTDRTLTKNGDWNTLCLPFSLSAEQIAASELAGATIKELDNSDSGTNLDDEGLLTLKFNNATSITAGKPYLIKWETTGENIVNPVFTGVTITSTMPSPIVSNDQKVIFVGQYSPFEIVESGATSNNQGNKNEIILLSTGNKLGYSKNPRTIANGKALKCFRCHFMVAADDEQKARSFVLDLDEGEEITGILTIENESSQREECWYTLDGRKLDKMPAKKGIYISNKGKIVKR